MSAILPFLPSFGELKLWHLLAKLKEQAQELAQEQTQELPTSSFNRAPSFIQVIILDSKEWHFGATAPYIGDVVKQSSYAGSCLGP